MKSRILLFQSLIVKQTNLFSSVQSVISHDRWFLDRICTHILAFEGNSNVYFYEGSYSEYEEHKLKRLGKEEPTRVHYRKLGD